MKLFPIRIYFPNPIVVWVNIWSVFLKTPSCSLEGVKNPVLTFYKFINTIFFWYNSIWSFMLSMHFVFYAFCLLCILSFMHFVFYAFCLLCIFEALGKNLSSQLVDASEIERLFLI